MKSQPDDWFDWCAYGVLTLVLTAFILFFIQRREELLALLNLFLFLLCLVLMMRYLDFRKEKKLYDAFFHWLEHADGEDTFPQELTESVERMRRSLKRETSYEALQANMEFAVLQNQINPHFLYNTLDAIRSQALEIHADEIADMTGKLSRFFRYSIRNQGDLVSVSQEIENVQDYFSIQHYRFEDRFSLSIHCEDESLMGYYLPKMTFQPLVENALYHGLEKKKGKGNIRIRIEQNGTLLHVVISDDGVGIDAARLEELNSRFYSGTPMPVQNEKKTGIALTNVNQRLKLLFGEPCGLHITSTQGMGTDVEVLIPLVDEERRGQYRMGGKYG
ncbi:sensor histidine kinase [Hominifimenecus sp. rT4P-3]|uniref:sensor histidine kinase n=1 Tax=Hominifimenecus sp. rT4P-3 TaxID=3242979 RepID=UPI003DA2ADB0